MNDLPAFRIEIDISRSIYPKCGGQRISRHFEHVCSNSRLELETDVHILLRNRIHIYILYKQNPAVAGFATEKTEYI